MDIMIVLISLGLSLVLPVTIIAIRNTVKRSRQGIIRDLEGVFRLTPPNEAREGIVPSFEFVKFKYFIGGDERMIPPKDTPLWAFLISVVPLVLVTFVFGLVAFQALLGMALPPPWDAAHLPPWYVRVAPPDLAPWLLVLTVAYLASYLFVITELLRAVENFDLSPTTFLAAAVHMLFGVITAVIVALASKALFLSNSAADLLKLGTPALIIIAFVVGFVPGIGLRAVFRGASLMLFKREDEQVYEAFKTTPLEVVDGIDSSIRSRLERHQIYTVQNLATINPIMLFVETPYGVYQVIDWVAQAQLCTAVGPKALTEFWKLGVRTIFDLERAMLEDGFTTPELRRCLGEAMLVNSQAACRKFFKLLPDQTSPEGDAALVSLTRVIIDDLHIQRLRQIWNRITERLDPANLRLTSNPLRNQADNAA